MDDRETIEHMNTDADAKSGISLVVSLITKGKKSEEVMAALCVAVATCNVLFSPDEAARDQNHEKSAEFIKLIANDMWPDRVNLEAHVKRRIENLAPMAAMLGMIMGKSGAPAEAERETEKSV